MKSIFEKFAIIAVMTLGLVMLTGLISDLHALVRVPPQPNRFDAYVRPTVNYSPSQVTLEQARARMTGRIEEEFIFDGFGQREVVVENLTIYENATMDNGAVNLNSRVQITASADRNISSPNDSPLMFGEFNATRTVNYGTPQEMSFEYLGDPCTIRYNPAANVVIITFSMPSPPGPLPGASYNVTVPLGTSLPFPTTPLSNNAVAN